MSARKWCEQCRQYVDRCGHDEPEVSYPLFMQQTLARAFIKQAVARALQPKPVPSLAEVFEMRQRAMDAIANMEVDDG